jgi:DNA-directed RNA polymerase, mitochondrial
MAPWISTLGPIIWLEWYAYSRISADISLTANSQTLNCIGTLFKGAKDIQTWLNHCARLISRSIPEDRVRQMLMAEAHYRKNSKNLTAQQQKQWEKDRKAGMEQMTTVIWTTLLGLPIVQPYRKAARKQVLLLQPLSDCPLTSLQIMTQLQSVYISDPNQPHAGMGLSYLLYMTLTTDITVNPMKQVSAFPPNFVHSLDATHMMLTALQCDVSCKSFPRMSNLLLSSAKG